MSRHLSVAIGMTVGAAAVAAWGVMLGHDFDSIATATVYYAGGGYVATFLCWYSDHVMEADHVSH